MEWKISLVLLIFLTTAAIVAQAENPHGADIDDNDFAEFEDFDDEEDLGDDLGGGEDGKDGDPQVIMSQDAEGGDSDVDMAEDDDATVEDEEDEFVHLQDEEEFEGFHAEHHTPKGKGSEKPPDLKITKIPLHLRTNWDSFYLEMLMLAGLGVYFLNFLAGKSKNSRLAQAWLSSHKELLENNFHIVGDDGQSTEVTSGVLMKESENVYSLWCSGRVCCEGMLVTLKLLKRQDLVSSIARMFKPASDQIMVKVTLDDADMDSFVMCLANKKVCGKLHKELNDLSLFCPEKKKVDNYGLPSSFQLLSEIGEATSAVLDRQVITALNKYESQVEYVHISDQFSGPRQQDDSQSTSPAEVKKVMIFNFNVPGRGKCSTRDMENMKPLMQMVFYLLDKVRRIRLSKDSKVKAERRRQKVEETMLKASHAQRQEAAQARREEKRRAEKERIMNEDDPDKQRKWEERMERRDAKKKQPKVKMMKMKAM